MNYFIVILGVILYFMSFGGVCIVFDERNVDPKGILPWVILLTPLMNTLYWLIFGVEWKFWKQRSNETLHKLFDKRR